MSAADHAGAPARRIFIGLFPGPGVQAAIDEHRRGWYWPPGSSRPQPWRLHLTLHFFGALDAAAIPPLQQALAGVVFDPFTLWLGRPELWRHNGVAVLCPEPSAELSALHQASAAAVRSAGLLPAAADWQPHVTLGRRAAAANPPDAPLGVRWPVAQFVLVESLHAPLWRYDVLARYGARGSGPP